MQKFRAINYRPIFDSKGGVHFTAYLVNQGNVSGFQKQLQKLLQEASVWFNVFPTLEEKLNFLQPLQRLLDDPSSLSVHTSNIGIYRNETSF